MNWYYADEGRQSGPVTEPELDELVRSGGVPASALVWTEGMGTWLPYTAARQPEPIGTQPGAGPAHHRPFEFTRGSNCISCGRAVPANEAAAIGWRMACSTCKAVYIQRLREGQYSSLPGSMPYSGFWMRVVARMADTSLLSVVNTLLTVGVFSFAFNSKVGEGGDAVKAFGISTLAGMAISCGYETYFLSKMGATPGKLISYMKVVHADGSAVGAGTAIGRYFATILSHATMYFGIVMAAFDFEKRTLHDRVVGTRVVDSPPATGGKHPLEPVSRAVSCGKCQTELPVEYWNQLAPAPCPGCNAPVQATIFPALSRSLPEGHPALVEAEGDASCYYHAGNLATVTCEECGRFLCAVCDLDGGTRRLCPACFTIHLNDEGSPEFVHRRTNFDSIALTVALLPLLLFFTVYFTLVTAPAAVGLSIWSWSKPLSITPRNRWRFAAALIVALGNIVLIGAFFVTVLFR